MIHAVGSDVRDGCHKTLAIHDIYFSDPQTIGGRRAGPDLLKIVQRDSGHDQPVHFHSTGEKKLSQVGSGESGHPRH
jgi:cbb3-type cytochrome oxidase cytochrome c subunit